MSKSDRIREMLIEGIKHKEISNEVGVAKSTISYHAKQLGLSKHMPTYDLIKMQAHYDAGNTIRETIKHFGLNRSTWNKYVRLNRIKLDNTPEREALLKESRKVDSRSHTIPIDEMFIRKSNSNTTTIRNRIKRDSLMIYSCDMKNCPLYGIINPKWCGNDLILHLDHINGVSNDHRLKNLRWLCANCHTQTSTYCGRNIKNY